MLTQQLLLLALLPLIQAQETVLGIFMLSRHGDRTAKAWPPANLTDLGYNEVFAEGTYYRNRYINSTSPIFGISQNIVANAQLTVQAPVDVVLQSSAQGFLQGLYPPVGSTLGSATLHNGTTVQAPLNGYQIIPINQVASISGGSNSENSVWLQGASGCNKATVSSNNYFLSSEYLAVLNSTNNFFQSLNPVVNGSFPASYVNFKNAYSVWDLINVATINNATINSSDILTSDVLFQLRTLADQHEFNLAYNSSDTIRAIAGSTLAAQILQSLNNTITTKSASKMGIQFNAYGSFSSFFGLAGLAAANPNFTAVVDYASSMVFELVTNQTGISKTNYPTTDNISVRFLFSNGSAAYGAGLVPYPLFGQSQTLLPYNTFVSQMSKFAIGDQADWCSACGNSTGVCASTSTTSSSASAGSSSGAAAASSSDSGNGGGMSLAVAGVIGAFVTLAVILGLEALILLIGGLRLVSKRRLAAANGGPGVVGNGDGVAGAAPKTG